MAESNDCVWEIPVSSRKERLKDENNQKLHPTQKPEKLLYNILISSSKQGTFILDPLWVLGQLSLWQKD